MAGLFVLVQLIGFLLLLTAFASMQLLGLPSGSRVNFVLNLVGASLLAVDALYDRQWAFCPRVRMGPGFALCHHPFPLKRQATYVQELPLSDKAGAGHPHPNLQRQNRLSAKLLITQK